MAMNIEPLLPHSDEILYLCQDNNASAAVGRIVPISAVTKQYSRAIVGQDQRVITTDHDWDGEKVITSVTLCMNITET